MRIVHSVEDLPESWTASIFLVGPSPRKDTPVPSWRPQALALLEDSNLPDDTVVFVPEPRDGSWPENYDDQVEWEQTAIDAADVIWAWVPRDLDNKMLGLTTNTEIGEVLATGKLVLGAPPEAHKVRYLAARLSTVSQGTEKLHDNMGGCVARVVALIGDGALRSGGERKVPIGIWKHSAFQSWYKAQTEAGNRLDDARQLWLFRIWKANFNFAFTLWVKVWISSEHRWKENEFIFGRPDISTILLYNVVQDETDRTVASLLTTEVILVREFRSPARTDDGFVRELAGGSSWKPGQDHLTIAAEEVHEETGLSIPAKRFTQLNSRQLCGTLSVHKAHLFAAELTVEEMEEARELASTNQAFGVEADSERTYVEVTTVHELLQSESIDWSMLGMIFQGLCG